MTITMDDIMLNGTNRVVLDGVMTQTECDKILHLASVSKSIKTLLVRPKVKHTINICLHVSDRLLHLLEMVTKGDNPHTHPVRHLKV